MKKSLRQGRRGQPLSVHDPRRPHLGPQAFKARAPGLSGKERGRVRAGRQSPARDAPLRPVTPWLPLPNPRPCPQASAKQNKLVQASCCATQSRVSRGRMRAADGRRLQGPRGRNQRAARPKPSCPARPCSPLPGCTCPAPYALRGQGPHRASALIILVLSLLASQMPPRSRGATRETRDDFSVSPYRYLIESSIG